MGHLWRESGVEDVDASVREDGTGSEHSIEFTGKNANSRT